MQVRTPSFDFDGFEAVWADNREAAHAANSSHLVPAHIEPFLIKVMRRAKAELDPVRDARLIEDIEIFNKQEGQHNKVHGGYMRALRDQGYAEVLAPIEAAYGAEYERFLGSKSLPFLLAYCEGFEALASSIAFTWVDLVGKHGIAGDEGLPVDIWRWHLAEEYEHRTVVFRAYHRLSGKGPIGAYFHRVAMYFYAQVHYGKFVNKMAKALLEQDRRSMTDTERAQSRRRERAVMRATLRSYFPSVLRPLSPWYDPERTPAPQHTAEQLERFSH